MSGPISPDDINERKAASVPDAVYDAINDLITEKWNGKEARFKQKTLEQRLELALGECKREWLNFEDAYRAMGWGVRYDRPGYNENYYDAYFVFSKRTKAPMRPIHEIMDDR